jgi:hypothetical protein
MDSSAVSLADPANPKVINEMSVGQPTVFQTFNEDKSMIRTHLLVNTKSGSRKVFWMEDSSTIKNREFADFVADSKLPGAAACQDYSQVSNEKILHPDKASSFLDINGDCAPDFVLQTINKTPTDKDYLEIYLYMTSIKKFCLVAIEPVNNTYAMASFADLSRLF